MDGSRLGCIDIAFKYFPLQTFLLYINIYIYYYNNLFCYMSNEIVFLLILVFEKSPCSVRVLNKKWVQYLF